jgi:hypothetical protein
MQKRGRKKRVQIKNKKTLRQKQQTIRKTNYLGKKKRLRDKENGITQKRKNDSFFALTKSISITFFTLVKTPKGKNDTNDDKREGRRRNKKSCRCCCHWVRQFLHYFFFLL